jgi:N-methylhydantoinase A/oxoprolinase/acetone carboxylase beta subunit
VQSIKAAGINSIAVSLLHAYANPVHENETGQPVEPVLPVGRLLAETGERAKPAQPLSISTL